MDFVGLGLGFRMRVEDPPMIGLILHDGNNLVDMGVAMFHGGG